MTLDEWRRSQIERVEPLAIAVDPEFRVLFWSGNLEPWSLDLKIGDDLREILPLLYSQGVDEPWGLQSVNLPNGWVIDIQAEPIADQAYLLLRDVRQRHDAVQEQQQERNEIELLRRRLNTALNAAEEASRAKSQFIASMSHEFRTPLTAIQGYADRMRNESDPGVTEAGSAIYRASDYLLTLVNNLIDQARLESREMVVDVKPTSLPELAALLREIFQPLAEQRHLQLSVSVDEELPEWVMIDPTKLRQIAVNLLGNACKFTPKGSVGFSLAWSAGDLTLVVSDTGPGIAPENQVRIFGAFERIDEHAPGAGLGLTISRQIAERLGGSLTLESELGRGSRFILRLPAALCAAPEPSHTDPQVEGLNILLVEDDDMIARLLQLIIEDSGHAVQRCPDGLKAASLITEGGRIDCVITDMNLPGMSGIELIKHARKERPDCRIVTLSASTRASDRERALAAGADSFESKPIDPDRLIQILSPDS